MTPQLVVFDLAGTTVRDNRDVHRVLQRALREYNVVISLDDANEVMGIPKPEAIERLLVKRHLGRRIINDRWINDIHLDFVEQMSNFYRLDPSVGEKEGVTDVFRTLKSMGVKVAVDTGFDRAITDPLLDRLGWQRNTLIDCSVTSDEVRNGRPHPDMILKVMKLTGVDRAISVAKVGDTASDMLEGAAAGCGWVIGVTTGAFTRQQLAREPHSHLVDQVAEILPILEIPRHATISSQG